MMPWDKHRYHVAAGGFQLSSDGIRSAIAYYKGVGLKKPRFLLVSSAQKFQVLEARNKLGVDSIDVVVTDAINDNGLFLSGRKGIVASFWRPPARRG